MSLTTIILISLNGSHLPNSNPAFPFIYNKNKLTGLFQQETY